MTSKVSVPSKEPAAVLSILLLLLSARRRLFHFLDGPLKGRSFCYGIRFLGMRPDLHRGVRHPVPDGMKFGRWPTERSGSPGS